MTTIQILDSDAIELRRLRDEIQRLNTVRIPEFINDNSRLEQRARTAESKARGLELANESMVEKLGQIEWELQQADAQLREAVECLHLVLTAAEAIGDVDPELRARACAAIGKPDTIPAPPPELGKSSFKIGDRVVMIEPDAARSGVGIVESVCHEDTFPVVVTFEGGRYACREGELRRTLASTMTPSEPDLEPLSGDEVLP